MRAHINIFPLLIGGWEVKKFGYPGMDTMLVILSRKPGKAHAPSLTVMQHVTEVKLCCVRSTSG